MTDFEKLILDKLSGMEERFENIEQLILKNQMIMENDISKKMDISGERHDFLKQRLDSALLIEMKRENMEFQLINL